MGERSACQEKKDPGYENHGIVWRHSIGSYRIITSPIILKLNFLNRIVLTNHDSTNSIFLIYVSVEITQAELLHKCCYFLGVLDKHWTIQITLLTVSRLFSHNLEALP